MAKSIDVEVSIGDLFGRNGKGVFACRVGLVVRFLQDAVVVWREKAAPDGNGGPGDRFAGDLVDNLPV